MEEEKKQLRVKNKLVAPSFNIIVEHMQPEEEEEELGKPEPKPSSSSSPSRNNIPLSNILQHSLRSAAACSSHSSIVSDLPKIKEMDDP
jgi:hypothetical protein